MGDESLNQPPAVDTRESPPCCGSSCCRGAHVLGEVTEAGQRPSPARLHLELRCVPPRKASGGGGWRPCDKDGLNLHSEEFWKVRGWDSGSHPPTPHSGLTSPTGDGALLALRSGRRCPPRRLLWLSQHGLSEGTAVKCCRRRPQPHVRVRTSSCRAFL